MTNFRLWSVLLLSLTILFGACQDPDDPMNDQPSCTNGILDGDETDIDCGGSCPACPQAAVNPFPMDTVYSFDGELKAIKFFSPWVGFVSTENSLGSKLLKTVDGGDSWSIVLTPATMRISDIEFGQSSDVVFIADANYDAFRSVDGGSNWTAVSVGQGAFSGGSNVEIFTDSSFIWNSNLSSIAYTTDAAQTTGYATINGSTNLDASDHYAIFNDTLAYTLMRDGSNGNLYFYKTEDAGAVWDLVSQPFNQHVSNFWFQDPDVGYVVVGGDLAKTTNGGNTWSIAYADCDGNNELTYINNGKGVSMCSWPLYTNDNGSSWNTYKNSDGSDFALFLGGGTGHLHFGMDNMVYLTTQDNKTLLTYDLSQIN